jgi:hypothetical protein
MTKTPMNTPKKRPTRNSIISSSAVPIPAFCPRRPHQQPCHGANSARARKPQRNLTETKQQRLQM